MKKCLLFLTAVILFGCAKDETSSTPDEGASSVYTAQFKDSDVVQGQLIIKLAEEPEVDAKGTVAVTRSGGTALFNTGFAKFDEAINGLATTSMDRVFPIDNRYEARTRGAGMHLWYVIKYDESTAATRAASQVYNTGAVTAVEPVRRVKSQGRGQVLKLAEDIAGAVARSASDFPFNDPGRGEQWNLINDGSMNGSVAGADVGMKTAWSETTGANQVIIAVVDDGIGYSHEDIAANMWVNTSEKNGTSGADNDSNGYADDIYGYNFVSNSGTIKPGFHGTHVAGVIAAVNNNGIGVSSIAGGNGTSGSGVRLMSCQIFEEDQNGEESSATNAMTAAAIKYGADNGAVISQNSWGYEIGTVNELPAYMQDAINYFVTFAGVDANGNQIGPMKGGILVFAAGNEGSATPVFPAASPMVVSVAAMKSNYGVANYSNYNRYINLMAPGGEFGSGVDAARGGILSPVEGYYEGEYISDNYAYMIGTSMACPHVSGVAALVISKYGVGTTGFTPSNLKRRLFNGSYDIYAYNPTYAGLLGIGGVYAPGALDANSDGGYNTPEIVRNLDDINLGVGSKDVIYLNNYFSDPDEGELTFAASAKDGTVLDVVVSGVYNLRLTGLKVGHTTVSVTAFNENGLSVSAYFEAVVYTDGAYYDIYPTKVTDGQLWISAGLGGEGSAYIEIYNSMGAKVFSSSMTFALYDPQAIDVSGLSAGVYTIVAERNGTKLKRTFVKY